MTLFLLSIRKSKNRPIEERFTMPFHWSTLLILFLKQRADPGDEHSTERQRHNPLKLFFPIVAKVVVTGTTFCFRNIVLEKLCLGDKDIIQGNNVKGLETKKNDKEADQKLCEAELSLYAIPCPINDHSDKAQDTQDHKNPADHRRTRKGWFVRFRLFFDIRGEEF